ncbi:MAG: hypothetical protein IJ716_06520 [Lachnospiraceae bacterium]|nr:hypothetical protein [Lachnospiraceae bacterium]
MAKGLLLGNGINARIGIRELSIKDIGKRFYHNMEVYTPVIEKVFGVITNEEFIGYIEKKCMECGIETLAGYLYKYVRENKKNKWTDNDEYRIQDIISCICLSAIFFTNNGKIKENYDETKMFSVDKYDYVYTLNYIEFWDRQNRSVYLHGRVDISKISKNICYRYRKNAVEIYIYILFGI